MAQTRGRGIPFIDLFNRADPVRQRLVWLYYLGQQTNDAAGLKVNEGAIGSVGSYDHCGNIKYYITSTQWRYQAKVCLLCAVCCASIFFVYCRFRPVYNKLEIVATANF